MRLAFLLALIPALALAQSSTPRPEDLGTITGHITCADTQRPARLATVTLQPIKHDASDPDAYFKNFGRYGPVHTDLTGAYMLTDVPPGQYYLIVALDGYTNPFSQFTSLGMYPSSPEIQRQIRNELQIITIAPNSTTRADTTLYRAGSISGTVTYDDGAPAIGMEVAFLGADPNAGFRRGGISIMTDSHGRYNIDSLPPGTYIVQVMLRAMERRLGRVTFGDLRSKEALMDMASFTLPVYSGSVFRQKDAQIIKVEAGQDTDDVDITLPLGKLHEVSGTLVAKDGHAINSGRIDIFFADTHELLTATEPRDNGTFDLRFVPDGSYIIKVSGAGDVIHGLTVNGATPPVHTESRPIHTYGDLEQPLTVQTDIQSLNLTIPDKPASTPPSQ